LFPVIADVTDPRRMEAVFRSYRPNVVFHAAAHKHVPLMELNRVEAVKNNVFGTKVVADAAMHHGVSDFVMISTDKAVRPISIMGATKRLAEMYVQSLNPRSETRFMTVRFGNVLGSEGSVFQIFQRQIEHGGPVTITHREMKRYFMTIPEASQLVLQAATQGKGGDIFVLDMGEPVQIVDLAKDLIALSGLDPEKDIEIKFTGVRPGEKIFEELLNAETRVVPTSHVKVMVVETDPLDHEDLERKILALLDSAHAGDEKGVLLGLRELVPDYQPGRVDAEETLGLGDGRILVIEDDAYTRMTLKRVLETSYQVLDTRDYQGALQHLQVWRPDLVILGCELPDTNVRRLCARLKEENGGIPVILVGDSEEAVSPKVLSDVGADDRIYRPIPVDILRGRVQRLLSNGAPENGERGIRKA
jgi:dTDP-4-dehydrorhamnose reductase/CheY-like chemotaxis protein